MLLDGHELNSIVTQTSYSMQHVFCKRILALNIDQSCEPLHTKTIAVVSGVNMRQETLKVLQGLQLYAREGHLHSAGSNGPLK